MKLGQVLQNKPKYIYKNIQSGLFILYTEKYFFILAFYLKFSIFLLLEYMLNLILVSWGGLVCNRLFYQHMTDRMLGSLLWYEGSHISS
jgi:hypothetical protein